MNYENLTKDQLINEIYQLQTRQKYGLVFKEHPEDIISKSLGHIPVFEEVRSRCVMGSGVDHLLLESDNHPALLALSSQYKGRVDLILTDPPYGTGAKDFIYNDHFVDKDDTWRHSKWISFMNRRLCLAKELLSDNGAIFICIDDNHLAQLKMLCDQIFGEDNFVGNIVWRCRSGANDADNKLSTDHEYLLVYSKNHSCFNMNGIDKDFSRYSNPDNDPRGEWVAGDLRNPHDDPKMLGVLVDPATGNKFKGYWRISQKNYDQYINDGRVLFPKNKDGVPKLKRFKSELRSTKKPYSSFLNGFLTQHGTSDIKDIFGGKIFDYPKPTKLMKELIFQASKPNSIILDFFAGSGTTLHAVAELNKEDGGQRKCILITNNENQICENITYQRCKKVITGYTTPKGKTIEPTGGNLHYYRLNWVEQDQDAYQMRQNLKAHMTPLICMAEETFQPYWENGSYDIFQNEDQTKTTVVLKKDTPKTIEKLKAELKPIRGPIVVYQPKLTGGVDSDLAQRLGKRKLQVKSSVDDYVKLYQSLTHQERLKYEEK